MLRKAEDFLLVVGPFLIGVILVALSMYLDKFHADNSDIALVFTVLSGAIGVPLAFLGGIIISQEQQYRG